jgi:hypothetical protein
MSERLPATRGRGLYKMRILEIIGSVDPRDGGAVEGLLRQSSVRAGRGLETISLRWTRRRRHGCSTAP